MHESELKDFICKNTKISLKEKNGITSIWAYFQYEEFKSSIEGLVISLIPTDKNEIDETISSKVIPMLINDVTKLAFKLDLREQKLKSIGI